MGFEESSEVLNIGWAPVCIGKPVKQLCTQLERSFVPFELPIVSMTRRPPAERAVMVFAPLLLLLGCAAAVKARLLFSDEAGGRWDVGLGDSCSRSLSARARALIDHSGAKPPVLSAHSVDCMEWTVRPPPPPAVFYDVRGKPQVQLTLYDGNLDAVVPAFLERTVGVDFGALALDSQAAVMSVTETAWREYAWRRSVGRLWLRYWLVRRRPTQSSPATAPERIGVVLVGAHSATENDPVFGVASVGSEQCGWMGFLLPPRPREGLHSPSGRVRGVADAPRRVVAPWTPVITFVEPVPSVMRLTRMYHDPASGHALFHDSAQYDANFEEVAVAAVSGNATFWGAGLMAGAGAAAAGLPKHFSQLGSLLPDVATRELPASALERITVTTVTYADLLARITRAGSPPPAVVIVDAEGVDAEVVGQVLRRGVRAPLILYFEHAHIDAVTLAGLLAEAAAAGYACAPATFGDTACVHAELVTPSAVL